MLLASCSSDKISVNPDAITWSGADIEFVKLDGGDPSLEVNQDRITDNVWITRSNDGGQIFNIKIESEVNKTKSPEGTAWAIGSTSESIENLTFQPFRAAVEEPSQVVGKDLILYLIDDNIFIDIRFTSWSPQKAGGFAYVRSTP